MREVNKFYGLSVVELLKKYSIVKAEAAAIQHLLVLSLLK